MSKKTTIAFTFSIMVLLLWSSTALPHYSSGVEGVGERTASFLASPFIAAFDPAPLTYRPPLYLDAPQVPPGQVPMGAFCARQQRQAGPRSIWKTPEGIYDRAMSSEPALLMYRLTFCPFCLFSRETRLAEANRECARFERNH